MSKHNVSQEKARLHIRNRNRKRYHLDALKASFPELAKHIRPNKHGSDSIDFSDPRAVKLLNRALLSYYYEIKRWDFPDTNLCPPIPGRADYIHHMADLLGESNSGIVPVGDRITCLDVGVGATCIYPIIGLIEYGWSFVGSEIDQESLDHAQEIIDANSILGKNQILLRLQKDSNNVFSGIIGASEKIDLTVCNPPFYSSAENADRENLRKVKKLTKANAKEPKRNFSGSHNELVCKGGAAVFIRTMISESKKFGNQCLWFSTLVAKQSHLKGIRSNLRNSGASEYKVIMMGTGNKSTRIVAWTFQHKAERENWSKTRWRDPKS